MTEGIHHSPRARHAGVLLALLLTATLALGAAQRTRSQQPVGATTAAGTTTAADGTVTLQGTLDRGAVLLGDDGVVRMELLLEGHGRDAAKAPRAATDLVVVLDRSGSMGGAKIEAARAAVHHLIGQLGPEDRFALVPFSTAADTAISLGRPTPSARRQWRATVDEIDAGGGTYMAKGLGLGLLTIESARAAGRTPRLILISDGLAAEEPVVLLEQATRAARGEFALSTVGVGADFDEVLMARLADAGTGNYFFLDDAARLADVFAAEFETARETVASGLRVILEPAAGVEVVDAAGYPLEHSHGQVSFRPGTLFHQQQRRIWVTFRVPTNEATSRELGGVRVQYSARGEAHQIRLEALPAIETVRDRTDFYAAVDSDTWARSVSVEEYNDLRLDVARKVKAGRPEEARGAILGFAQRNSAMNDALPTPVAAVSEQIAEAEKLIDELDEAYVGPDQARKQNLLGKELHESGTASRRAGSRK